MKNEMGAVPMGGCRPMGLPKPSAAPFSKPRGPKAKVRPPAHQPSPYLTPLPPSPIEFAHANQPSPSTGSTSKYALPPPSYTFTY